MALSKNVIQIRFLNIQHHPKTRNWFDYKNPYDQKTYSFYISPSDRKNVDIGSIVKIRDAKRKLEEAVIIDNITVYNAKHKHRPVDVLTGRHVRGYIRATYQNNGFAKVAYGAFRSIARQARIRVAIQNEQNRTKA